MRLVARWGLAVMVSAAVFAVSWWVCQDLAQLDEGASLAIAGAVLAVVLTIAGWWAGQDRPSAAGPGAKARLVQNARADRDINMAGCDQVIINYQRGDE